MSMTSLSFRCDKCDFIASSMVLWGHINYKNNGKSLNVNRKLGWCDDCRQICPIEELASPQTLEVAIAKHRELQATLNSLTEPLKLKRSFLARLLKLEPVLPNTFSSLKSEIAILSDDIQEMREQLSFFENRKSSPRCLSCGSHRISSLPNFEYPDEVDDYDEAKTVYVMPHPICGGAIKVHNPSIRFTMKMRERVFDIEGIEIKNEVNFNAKQI